MSGGIEEHYSSSGRLTDLIAAELRAAGKDLAHLSPGDLEAVDEFHVRGRRATLELADRMRIAPGARVLDIGSGLGGPARTIAQHCQCHVTGIDLTPDFCEAARQMSEWVGLSDRTTFRQGDATALGLEPSSFDAAYTIHAAMNIARKDKVYAGVRRALKPGGTFGIYDILQGEGGEVLYPVPWAREPSISHLATVEQLRQLLGDAGFAILAEVDTSAEGAAWFKDKAARLQSAAPPPIGFSIFLGNAYAQMAANQVRNLSEGRIKTVMYVVQVS